MPIPTDFSASPHVIPDPATRWLPDEPDACMEKLPSRMQKLRRQVKEWRD